MRLIDADALLEKFSRNSIYEKITNAEGKNVLEIIEEQPIAYDVDKVVEQLRALKEEVGFMKDVPGAFGYCLAINKAIKIVRNGGVSE